MDDFIDVRLVANYYSLPHSFIHTNFELVVNGSHGKISFQNIIHSTRI